MLRLFSICLLMGLAFIPRAATADPIKIIDATIQREDDGTLRISISATGAQLKSFGIRLDERPGTDVPSQFVERNGYYYLNVGNDAKPIIALLDNSAADEDPAAGSFETAINTADWPVGKYVFMLYADNRPGPGTYISSQKIAVMTIGDPSQAPSRPVSNIPGAEQRVIFQEDGIYAIFPELFVLADGRWAISFGTKVHRDHINREGGNKALVSADEGRTWEPYEGVLTNQRWKTGDGRLVTAEAEGWIYVPAEKSGELAAQHKYTMRVNDKTIAYLGGARSRVSTDDGKTWQSSPMEIPDYIAGLMNYHKTASELVTSQGIRLNAIYGRRVDDTTLEGYSPVDEVFLLRSTDDGTTWQIHDMYPNGLADPKLGFNETALEEAANGDIVAVMRSIPEGYLYQSISKDQGLSWSPAIRLDLWGTPADLLRLKDDTLLLVNGYRRGPKGIRAAISRDNGKTWTPDGKYILRQDGMGANGDLGYPLAVQLNDGSIFTLYYITTDGSNTHIAGTHWKITD